MIKTNSDLVSSCDTYGLARRSGKAFSWILEGFWNFIAYNPFSS